MPGNSFDAGYRAISIHAQHHTKPPVRIPLPQPMHKIENALDRHLPPAPFKVMLKPMKREENEILYQHSSPISTKAQKALTVNPNTRDHEGTLRLRGC